MIFQKFEEEFSKFDPIFMGIPWQDKGVYGAFLTQVFHFVKHSSRIMATVASHLSQEQEEIHTQLMKHANEEKGHQFLAKQDLKVLGYNLEDFPEFHSTKMFYETQYYKACYQNPIGFYGYALALEGTAVKRLHEIYKKCKAVYGEKACNFLRVHAEEDDEHVKNFLRLVEKLPNSDVSAIESNLKQSLYAMTMMFREIASYENHNTSVRAA